MFAFAFVIVIGFELGELRWFVSSLGGIDLDAVPFEVFESDDVSRVPIQY